MIDKMESVIDWDFIKLNIFVQRIVIFFKSLDHFLTVKMEFFKSYQ